MTSIPDQFPISLRAWPNKDDKSSALSTFHRRINDERGGLRGITEASLREEIAKAEAEGNTEGADELLSDEDDVEEPDRTKEVMDARYEMLMAIDHALYNSTVALNTVSLLLSQNTPVQASLSISPYVRDAVPLGTLGADKISDSRLTEERKDDNRRITRGWKIQSFNDSVDSILAAATRLEKEIDAETRYWEQVLEIDDKGWKICSKPDEEHSLAVRFGFLESAPAFRNRSLGTLRRNIDGNISLDQGILDPTPKQLQVRIETNGRITGQLCTTMASKDQSIEGIILEARDNIFEQELWQELSREARILANQGVRRTGEEISCQLTPSKRVVLTLMPIDENIARQSMEDDTLASMVSLALHLLLSHAHRQNLRRRSSPPPPISSRPQPNLSYALLRPILTRQHHEASCAALTALASSLTKTLQSAHIINSTFHYRALKPETQTLRRSTAELVIESIISTLEAEISVPLTATPAQNLTIRFRTSMHPIETLFLVTVDGPFADICRPPERNATLADVSSYAMWATACALAVSFQSPSPREDGIVGQPGDLEIEGEGWQSTQNPTALRKHSGAASKELAFRVSMDKGNVRLVVEIKDAGAGALGADGRRRTEAEAEVVGRVERKIFKYEGGGEGEVVPLREVVREAGRWGDEMNWAGEGVRGVVAGVDLS